MFRFVSLILILITYYWVSVLGFIASTKIINNTVEAPFGIPGASTGPENESRKRLVFCCK